MVRPRMLGPAVVAGLAAALLALTPAPRPAAAQAPTKGDLPPDLAIVHPEALGFVHVRLADVWKHDTLKDLREMVKKAGPKALAALDEGFVPKPSTAERVTVVVLPPPDGREEPRFVAAMRFTEPFDPAAAARTFAPAGKAMKAGAREYVADEQAKSAVHFPDNRTLVYGDPETLGEYLSWAPKDSGGLTEAVRAAASGTKPLFAAVNLYRLPLPPDVGENVPPEFKPFLKARLVTLTMDLKADVTLEARLTFATEAEAGEGEKAVARAADMARAQLGQQREQAEKALYGKEGQKKPRPAEELPEAIAGLAALGAIATAEEFLAKLPVKRDGSSLVATVTLPPWATQYFGVAALGAGLALPAIQKVRAAAAGAQASNNLKQIGLAMHNYHDAFGSMPAAAITDKGGKKLLSWRVAILPFIEQDNLYKQFKLDEPWDSEHNKKLIPMMPRVYADPRKPAEAGKTYYKVFVGGGAMFDWAKGRGLASITDGTSNTIMAASGGEAVVWTKPEEIEFDPAKPLADLFKPFGDLMTVFGDGSTRTLKNTVKEQTLKALITAAGGEVVADDF